MTDKYIEKNLIVINGLSESGKTSLCMHFVNKYKHNYYKVKNHFPELKEYHTHILNLVWNDMATYKSNWIIEGLHLNTAISHSSAYDIEEMQNTIVNHCALNNIKYNLIMCLPPIDTIPEELQIKYQECQAVYDQYKTSMNIYKYDYTIDSEYVKVDEYIERA